jgi:hypothetical protein
VIARIHKLIKATGANTIPRLTNLENYLTLLVSSFPFEWYQHSPKQLSALCSTPHILQLLQLFLITVSNFMEQNPFWEVNSRSSSQEILRLLWNSKIHCSVRKIPPLKIFPRQTNPVHYLTPYLSKVCISIILSTPRSLSFSHFTNFVQRKWKKHATNLK